MVVKEFNSPPDAHLRSRQQGEFFRCMRSTVGKVSLVLPPNDPSDELIHTSRGTAVCIGTDTTLLTCHHVCKDTTSVSLHSPRGGKMNCQVVKSNKKFDLAVLDVPHGGQAIDRALLATEVVRQGQKVHVIGCMTDGIISYNTGIVATTIFYDGHLYEDGQTKLVNVPIFDIGGVYNKGGCSGSPVFDSNGHVVGLIVGGVSDNPRGVCFAVSLPSLNIMDPQINSDDLGAVRNDLCRVLGNGQ